MTHILIALLLCGCGERAGIPPTKQDDAIRPLNEIPIEQLRVTLKGFPGDWRKDTDQSKGILPPPTEKPVSPAGKRIDLLPPSDPRLGAMPLRAAIGSRRSLRDFSPAPLALADLSFLLWSAQGVTGIERNDAGEAVQQFRAAPSAGARYPLETYVVVNRVLDLAPGLYRYLPSTHQLLAVRENADLAPDVAAACYGQAFTRDAATVFIWTAIPYRTEWKYAYLSHRMIAMEVGHVCQNVYLAAQSMGAGACAVLGYDQTKMDELLGVDGRDEFTLYVACVGKPAKVGN